MRLAADVRAAAWEVARETSARSGLGGPAPGLGALVAIVAELARALAERRAGGAPITEALAARVREHTAERQAAGAPPAAIVRELMLLRGALGRALDAPERRGPHGAALAVALEDELDDLLAGCVAAYLDGATAELARQARLDPLTSLLNRRALAEGLEAELARARRYGHGVVLVLLDVDDFKAVNDTLGHPEGDRVLRAVARVLRETLRASDLAARPGGDELAAVLLEAGPDAGPRLLARLREAIARLVVAGELPPRFGVSGGSAHFPSEAADADALARLADARLYEAKRDRRRPTARVPPPAPPAGREAAAS